MTRRRAGGGGQVSAQGRKGREQARSSLGHPWSLLAHGIAQLLWGSWEGARRWRSQERWPEKTKCNSARRVLVRVWINDRKCKSVLSGIGTK